MSVAPWLALGVPLHPLCTQMKPRLDRDPVLLTHGSWAQQGRHSPVISSRRVCVSLCICICRLHVGRRGAPASCILYGSATELAPLVKRSPVSLICNPESVVNQASRVCVCFWTLHSTSLTTVWPGPDSYSFVVGIGTCGLSSSLWSSSRSSCYSYPVHSHVNFSLATPPQPPTHTLTHIGLILMGITRNLYINFCVC